MSLWLEVTDGKLCCILLDFSSGSGSGSGSLGTILFSILCRRLLVLPEGYAKHRGDSLSLYLELVDLESHSSVQEVKVEFVMKLNDLNNQNHLEKKGNYILLKKTYVICFDLIMAF